MSPPLEKHRFFTVCNFPKARRCRHQYARELPISCRRTRAFRSDSHLVRSDPDRLLLQLSDRIGSRRDEVRGSPRVRRGAQCVIAADSLLQQLWGETFLDVGRGSEEGRKEGSESLVTPTGASQLPTEDIIIII